MKKQNKSDKNNVVYSTNPDYKNDLFDFEIKDEAANPKSKQVVRVTLDRKSRGGKEVTLVMGLDETEADLKELGSFLKSKCGVGGAVKDGEIIIQGDHREKVIKLLLEKGYSNTKRTGG